MGDEDAEIRTFKQKLLFYTTAFFILLGTFSLFSFLFLVPFVIEPAFTTIFMQFDETPALCITYETTIYSGSKNCTWSSCREGCTKDIYQCTQIRVNYKLNLHNYTNEFNITEYHYNLRMSETEPPPVKRTDRYERSIRDYDYLENDITLDTNNNNNNNMNMNNHINNIIDDDGLDHQNLIDDQDESDGGGGGSSISIYSAPGGYIRNEHGEMVDTIGRFLGNDSEWYYGGARLFPNVKGCGYPPMLNCTIWLKRYIKEGTKFPCYYSRVDPGLVISNLDMWQNTLNLVYSMAIPIPSFIISIIYLTFAYFKIYNEDEESAPLDKNAEGMAGDDDDDDNIDINGIVDNNNELNDDELLDNIESSDEICDVVIPNGGVPITPLSSDLNSFGHQLKVKMADEMSRESLDAGGISNSGSIQGNLSKTMTTSISTPPGPTAAV